MSSPGSTRLGAVAPMPSVHENEAGAVTAGREQYASTEMKVAPDSSHERSPSRGRRVSQQSTSLQPAMEALEEAHGEALSGGFMQDGTADKIAAVKTGDRLSNSARKNAGSGMSTTALRGKSLRAFLDERELLGAKKSWHYLFSRQWRDLCAVSSWKIDILQSPDGLQRRAWDLLIVLLVLLLIVTIPFESFVYYWHPSTDYKIFSYCIDGVFWIDIFINFNAAYYHGTHLVTDHKEIIKHYTWGNPVTHNTGWFWVDLMGNFPFELIASAGVDKHQRKTAKILKLLKLPKLLRVGRLLKYMGEYVTFAMFIQHGMLATFFLHAMASWYVGNYFRDTSCAAKYHDSHGGGHRLLLAGSDDAYYDDEHDGSCIPLTSCYLEAMMGVLEIVHGGTATVDGVPVNETPDYQKTLHLCTSFIGMLLNWLLQADLIVVMLNSTNAYTSHRVALDRAKQELDYFELPEDLKVKVRASMDYQWKAMVPSRCTLIKDESLSPMLRQEIVLHFHGKSLKHTALFAGCAPGCIAAAAMRLQTVVVRKHDRIITKGEVGRELYLLSKGKCAVSSDDVILAVIEEGQFFGETALVSTSSPYRTVDVVALVWCELQMLSQEDFKALCGDYPDVLKNAEMMMNLLEQDAQHCSALWNRYLKEKNRIFEECVAEAITQAKHPTFNGSRSSTNGEDLAAMVTQVDDVGDMARRVNPLFAARKSKLEGRVTDGSFRTEVLARLQAAKRHNATNLAS